MSFGPRIVVGAGMYGAGAVSKAGCTNESDDATSLCHVGIFPGLASTVPSLC